MGNPWSDPYAEGAGQRYDRPKNPWSDPGEPAPVGQPTSYLLEHPSQLDGIVYVAHPIGGDVENNVKSVLQLLRELHTDTCTPIAPYLVCLQYLRDDDPADRAKGIRANSHVFSRRFIDLLLLCGPKISTGMTGEVKLALDHGIPIRCRNPALVAPLEELVRKHRAGEL